MHFQFHLPPLPWSKSMETRWDHWPKSQQPCGEEKNWSSDLRCSLIVTKCFPRRAAKVPHRLVGQCRTGGAPTIAMGKSCVGIIWNPSLQPHGHRLRTLLDTVQVLLVVLFGWWHIKSEVGSPTREINQRLVFFHGFPPDSAWSMLWSVGPWQQLVVESWKFKLLRAIGWVRMDLTLWKKMLFPTYWEMDGNGNFGGKSSCHTHDHLVTCILSSLTPSIHAW